MKKYIIAASLAAVCIFVGSCKQEIPELTKPAGPDPGADPVAGTAHFGKFVAVGSSYTAGFQAGALFDEGQANSLPAILFTQFMKVGATGSFNQPTINSQFGYNIFVTNYPTAPAVLGRFLLQYNGSTSPKPTPQVSDIGALPNPAANPGFIYGDGSTKASLNNFGIEAIMLGQALITQTGNWGGTSDPRFSPFYARLAYPGNGTATLIGDIQASQATLLMFWLGMDDYMLYAAQGGDFKKAPLNNSPGAFKAQYEGAIALILGANPDVQVVLGNYPNLFAMPHFTSVPFNAIPLDAGTAVSLTTNLADNYNAFLDGMVGATVITQEQANKRYIHYVEGQNPVLLTDSDLTNLTPYMAGPYAGLLPYARARQATSADILPLSAGSVLGTLVGGDPNKVMGVSIPVADQFVIVPSERDSIIAARALFNGVVTGVQEDHADNFVVADVDGDMNVLLASKVAVYNGITITPNINPPTGIYSEDGLHPNTRGYAFLSHSFIKAINAKFGATIPLTDLSLYSATGLPIP